MRTKKTKVKINTTQQPILPWIECLDGGFRCQFCDDSVTFEPKRLPHDWLNSHRSPSVSDHTVTQKDVPEEPRAEVLQLPTEPDTKEEPDPIDPTIAKILTGRDTYQILCGGDADEIVERRRRILRGEEKEPFEEVLDVNKVHPLIPMIDLSPQPQADLQEEYPTWLGKSVYINMTDDPVTVNIGGFQFAIRKHEFIWLLQSTFEKQALEVKRMKTADHVFKLCKHRIIDTTLQLRKSLKLAGFGTLP